MPQKNKKTADKKTQTKKNDNAFDLSQQQITVLSRVLMATILLSGFWLFIQPSNVALFLLGFASVCMSLLAITFRKKIMTEYTKTHSKDNALTKPSEFAYKANTYVLWPAVFVAGLYAMYIAAF